MWCGAEMEEIKKVKSNGNLIAYDSCWQYWKMDDCLYSISTDGQRMTYWCSIARLPGYLCKLNFLHGYKFFSGNPNMCVIDREFVGGFIYG